MSVIIFIAVLAVLILSHELGHFIVAKKSGVRVDEFAFGFPPRLFKFKKGETLYSVNLIPFGGFVKIHGEEGQEKNDPRSFASKSLGIKAFIISAGVIFNILLAWFLISLGFMVGLPTSASAVPEGAKIENVEVVILQVQENTPAQKAGLQMGDQLIGFDTVESAREYIFENKGKEIEIKYKRGDEILSVFVVPDANPQQGKGALGILMDEVGALKLPFYRAVWEGLKTTINLTIAISIAIGQFIYDAVRGLAGFEQVSGPVGIATAAGSAANLGFAYLLSFIALLSVNLAVLNVIPFPALDGGRLLFLLIEKIKGSPVSYKVSSIVHTVGLIVLLILMLMITYKDILKLT